MPLDRAAIGRAVKLSQIRWLEEATAVEFHLKRRLPLLQESPGEFMLAPFIVGDASAKEVGDLIEELWNLPEPIIVISSDQSHCHDFDTARRIDRETSDALETMQVARIGPSPACGCREIHGLLDLTPRHRLRPRTVNLRNSRNAARPRDQVVGYGASVSAAAG